ncbi:diguanylate cyclase [bacterium]|nr:diguanylate cyclase [bacterium]
MGFFDNLKKFKDKINEVESTVSSANLSLLEVYERNAKLEKEIIARTKELDIANKQMLTLQHIWDMMNSSKPLSSVLNAIVNSLQGELGYLHSCIVKRLVDTQGEYLQFVACAGDMFEESFVNNFGCIPQEVRLKLPDSGEVYNAIIQNESFHSSNLFNLIKQVIPNSTDENVNNIISVSKTQSYIMVPLANKNVHFGSLIVFSSRKESTENELKFLNLFAKQIELAITIADLFQVVKEQATTDGMTALYNRRYFEEFIKKEALRANRQNQKFTVIGIDLDHLKKINDVYGHNYGDIAIKAIANVLKNSCRSIDIAARMGGEEFNVILSGVDSKGGMIFAERIRKVIESLNLEKIGHISASMGVGSYPEHSDDIDELLELVDHAMYESKRNGRNQVTLAKTLQETSWQDIAISTFIEILSKKKIPIDKNTTKLLNEKLQEMNINNEMLYNVSDTIVSTYNPEHTEGITRKKVLIATLLAKRFDLPKKSIDKLKIAILLYDIGNTMLPKELLSKKDPLTAEEKNFIMQHPVIAARKILEPISSITDVIPIIEKHHENWDGTGYPAKLSGEDIPLESQIILILDTYFALLENRPYRSALSKDEAINVISNDSGNKWNAKLANEFCAIIKEENL